MLVIKKNKYFFFLLLTFITSILIVWPFGNFPLNDDWSYSKSIVILTEQHKLDIGEWGAMTLLSHLLWGGLFVKLFGFSFYILRISTLISSLIGIIFLYRTLNLLTKNEALSFFGSLSLLFYPIYYNLSNTFMTDVNFNTLLVIASYCAIHYHLRGHRTHLVFIFVISAAMVLVRQFGILVPLAFTISCLFLKERRAFAVISSIILSLLVYGVFVYYETFLKTRLSDGAAYKFSGAFNLDDPQFYQTVLSRFSSRWKMIFVHLSLFTLPLTLLFILRASVQVRGWLTIIIVVCSGLLAYFVFHDISALQGNIFGNMYLGAETWYESLSDLPPDHAHTYSPSFQSFMELLKFFAVTTSCCSCILILLLIVRKRTIPAVYRPSIIYLCMFFVTYIGTLLIAESYFDRYHMPLITMLVIVIAFIANSVPRHVIALPAATVILIVYTYFSVAGTKDYFTLNNVRWQAYLDLRDGKGIDGGTVNAGFEVNCWNDGKPGWWTNMLCTEPYTWLIQYRPDKDFETIKKYPFTRVFPPGRDTVRVMKRTTH